MNVSIIGVPIDYGSSRRGTDMGPSAIRYAQLAATLRKIGLTVVDEGNIDVPVPESRMVIHKQLMYLDEIVEVCSALAERVEACLDKGSFPLVLGGDHSIPVGSVAGVARVKGEIGLIWMDAHGDFNTLETTDSGNIHGMSLAALLGRGAPELVQCGGFYPKLNEERVVLVGVRDLDREEKELLRNSNVKVFTIKDVDECGIAQIMQRAIDIAAGGGKPLHLSLDIDVLDPSEASGSGTPVSGGLTYREAHLALEIIAHSNLLCSMDVCEVNPILDRGGNQTARIAVELIASALGKSII